MMAEVRWKSGSIQRIADALRDEAARYLVGCGLGGRSRYV